MRIGTQKNDHGPWICLNWPVWHGNHLFCVSWTWLLQESKWPILLNLLFFSLVFLSLISSLEIIIYSILIVRKQEPSQLHPPYQFLLIPLPLLEERPGFLIWQEFGHHMSPTISWGGCDALTTGWCYQQALNPPGHLTFWYQCDISAKQSKHSQNRYLLYKELLILNGNKTNHKPHP